MIMSCTPGENFDQNDHDLTDLDVGKNVKDLADLFAQNRTQLLKNSVEKLKER
jgi:hypothetical protein